MFAEDMAATVSRIYRGIMKCAETGRECDRRSMSATQFTRLKYAWRKEVLVRETQVANITRRRCYRMTDLRWLCHFHTTNNVGPP